MLTSDAEAVRASTLGLLSTLKSRAPSQEQLFSIKELSLKLRAERKLLAYLTVRDYSQACSLIESSKFAHFLLCWNKQRWK